MVRLAMKESISSPSSICTPRWRSAARVNAGVAAAAEWRRLEESAVAVERVVDMLETLMLSSVSLAPGEGRGPGGY